jgi:hypothetical protein
VTIGPASTSPSASVFSKRTLHSQRSAAIGFRMIVACGLVIDMLDELGWSLLFAIHFPDERSRTMIYPSGATSLLVLLNSISVLLRQRHLRYKMRMFDYVLLALLVNTLLRRGLSQTAQISPSERRDRVGYQWAYDLALRTWPPGHRESTGSETVRPRAQRASRASWCVGRG